MKTLAWFVVVCLLTSCSGKKENSKDGSGKPAADNKKDDKPAGLEDIARAKAKALEKAVIAYYKDHDKYPASLSVLTEKGEQGGPYAEQDWLRDPWGTDFKFDITGPRNNGARPDVWTVTPDGKTVGNFR